MTSEIVDVFMIQCLRGDLPSAQSLVADHPEIDFYTQTILPINIIFERVCSNNQLDIVKWMKTTWPNLGGDALYISIIRQHNSIVEWLLQFYDVYQLRNAMNHCLASNNIDAAIYMIGLYNLDADYVDVSDRHRKQFIDLVEKYHASFKNKSARK